MKEDKIFLKFYDTNLNGVKPLNEIAPEKISVTHGVKQLNGNKDSEICLRNNNVKPLNEKSHPIDRIINKYY